MVLSARGGEEENTRLGIVINASLVLNGATGRHGEEEEQSQAKSEGWHQEG